jgi:hypothetical protein
MLRASIIAIAMALVLVAGSAHASLPGDANCNGTIGESDVAALIENIFAVATCSDADANQDHMVSAADLPALLAQIPPRDGPLVTFFGVASSGGDATAPAGSSDDGTPIYVRPTGIGFKLVIEGAAGASGKMVGRTVEPSTGRPDLQLETNHTLGDGSYSRCPGTVPAIDPPNYGAGSAVDQALRAFACGFQVASSSVTACTLNAFGNIDWVVPTTQTQFCIQVEPVRQFPSGQTRLTVQLRDSDGNIGPMKSVIVQIGNAPPATSTPSRTPTRTNTPTANPTATTTASRPIATATGSQTQSLPTATGTLTPSATAASRTATPTITSSPSPTPTRGPGSPSPTTQPLGTPTYTSTPTPNRSPTPSRTAAAATSTPTRTTTASTTPTRTATPTALPSNTPRATSTITFPPTITRTPTRTTVFTATRTVTRTPTFTPTPTPTPAAGTGPLVTFFGLSTASDMTMTPVGTSAGGVPIYQGGIGSGFNLVVEGRPGSSGKPVGQQTFNYAPNDPTVRPDLQIEVNRQLGDGSLTVCDNTTPIGGIPMIDPPSFAVTQAISDALNDLGCRFVDGKGNPGARSSADACTVFPDGTFGFVCQAASATCPKGPSTVQFCGQIARAFNFQPGDTLVTVQLRDSAGNTGPPAQIIISY